MQARELSAQTRGAATRALAALAREAAAQPSIAASGALEAAGQLLGDGVPGGQGGSGVEAAAAVAAAELVARLAGHPKCVGPLARTPRLLEALVGMLGAPGPAAASCVAAIASLATSELAGPALLAAGGLPAVITMLFRQQIKAPGDWVPPPPPVLPPKFRPYR